MIQIKKPKYEHDNYCACCRKPFEDSMEISFSNEHYNDSILVVLCGKCREELRKALEGKDTNVPTKWIPVSKKMPESADCPMDCLVTRKSKTIGNYTDMAVAESNGTWTHEDWEAIVLGDNVSGRKTGLLNTRGDEIVAWMPMPEPYMEEKAE